MMPKSADALLYRIKPRSGASLTFTIDGRPAIAKVGDTLLTALLVNGVRTRKFEFGDGDRAGFCLMGACQDCWVRLADGTRLRACSSLIVEGLAVVTEGQRHV